MTVKERAGKKESGPEKKRKARPLRAPCEICDLDTRASRIMLRLPPFRGSRSHGGRLKDKKKGRRKRTRPKWRRELTAALPQDDDISSLFARFFFGHASRVRYRTDNCRSLRRGSRGSLWKATTARRESRYRFSRGNLPESSRFRQRAVVDR